MDDLNKTFSRLLRSAAQAGDEPATAAPFGFDTRVVALWRAGANKPNGLAGLLRQVALLSAGIIVITSIAAVREVNQSREVGESVTNEFAIADSAIQDELLK